MATKEQYSTQYKYQQIVKAKLFIDMNFAEKIDLGQMAGQAHFSKFHFTRVFKNIYGITPHQYLVAVRIEQAQLLLKKNKSISDVCVSVGFDSVSTFKGLFKRETSCTPFAYKKSQQDLRSSLSKTPFKHIPHCLSAIPTLKKSNFQDIK